MDRPLRFVYLYLYKYSFHSREMAEKSLAEFKKEYEKLQKKYKLPVFDDLNRDFEIERVYERETDFPMREIRKVMMDKVLGYLNSKVFLSSR